ncbi:hypothetical protein GOX2727 (plasmid) [Gluconobacter oxydans 621H]|uniref:Uncharacterized protein n=1 Tax=Gluconobacter oxydans (strain 621H) TaxID=290633 RepID=Q5HXG3_GLUOX|nr:hypothetical protein GOX2727 [Gluconobacter oxydans 621H]
MQTFSCASRQALVPVVIRDGLMPDREGHGLLPDGLKGLLGHQTFPDIPVPVIDPSGRFHAVAHGGRRCHRKPDQVRERDKLQRLLPGILLDLTAPVAEGRDSLLEVLFVVLVDPDIHLDQAERFAALADGVHGLSAHEGTLQNLF